MPENRSRKGRGTDEPLFVTWQDPKLDKGESFDKACIVGQQALSHPDAVIHRASASNIYQNIAPGNVSVRDGYDRRDYEYFRPFEMTPLQHRMVMEACDEIYHNNGLIYNVVSLMSDFTCQGIDVVHPNKQIEKFCKAWWKKVDGPSVSERFTNYLYRLANVVIKRTMSVTKAKDRDAMQKGNASEDQPTIFEEDGELPQPADVQKYRIPTRYNFLNPKHVVVLGGDLATFIGANKLKYAIRINDNLARAIGNPKTEEEANLVAALPKEVRKSLAAGKKVIPLPMDAIQVFHFKKDDWALWAKPMTYAILNDVRRLDKMKLADLAALDGAISHIRLWRLGSLEHKLIPTGAAVQRLADMLINNVGGGAMDLIWGPDIELQETGTEVAKFLGEAKYVPVLNDIYAGLGIPPTLTGSSTQSGFTNNFISLRTLTERLNYGRMLLTKFWEYELKLLQRAMGFRFPPQVVFDRPVLTDETAELALIIQLNDRGLVSDEALRERFSFLNDLEEMRIKRESRARDSGAKPPRVGPYQNDVQHDQQLAQLALSSGQATPSQVGLNLNDNEDGQKSMLDRQEDMTVKQTKLQNQATNDQNDHQFRMEKMQLKHGVHPSQMRAGPTGVSGQGRPTNSKDGTKRKQKVVQPRTRAEMAAFATNMAWAKGAQLAIASVVNPLYLGMKGKNNLRQLTADEGVELENLKFAVLCNTPVRSKLSDEFIEATLAKELPIPNQVSSLLNVTTKRFRQIHAAEPTLDETRQLQASVYALYNGGELGESESV